MKKIAIVSMIILLSSCAGVKIVTTNGNNSTRGLRFYQPHPYLMVSISGDSVASKILYLPDVSREYAVQFKRGFGKTEQKITLNEGWQLTSINNTVEANPSELISSLVGSGVDLASLIKGATVAPTARGTKQGVIDLRENIRLYRIDFPPLAAPVLTEVCWADWP